MIRDEGAACGRLLCVGDIHGCARELEVLLEAVAPGRDDRLVFLGDYVDRGPSSADVVEILLELRQRVPGAVFLRGNHEEMFLSYLGLEGSYGEVFVDNGGDATLASYRVRGLGGARAARARAQVPDAHLDFLSRELRLYFEAPGLCFVHAGVRPGTPLVKQRRDDLLWIREAFLVGDHGLGATVVFGHTPYRDVLFDVPRRIGLDTGCVYGGRLSCLDFSAGVLVQVALGTRAATTRDVKARLGATIGAAPIDKVRARC